jgi:eukaryotic-like serine/threonine-protein kinase
MKQSLVVAVFISVLLTVVLVPLANADWPMFKADPCHSGVGTGNPILNPTLLWNKTYTGIYAWSSPSVSNGIIYSGFISSFHSSTYSSNYWYGIFSINASTGNPIWLYTSEHNTFNDILLPSPAIARGILFFGLNDVIYALNASNAKLLWNSSTLGSNGNLLSSPVVVNDVVYIGSVDGNIYSYNTTNGNRNWNYTTDSAVISSPAVANGIVYVNSLHTAYAFNATNGAKIWNKTGLNELKSSPTIVNGIVYFGSSNNNVYALNATNGNTLWVYKANSGLNGSPFETAPSVNKGMVFICSSQNNVNWPIIIYALNATTGKEVWTQTIGRPAYVGTLNISPTVVDEIVYVGAFGNGILAYNVTNGNLIWKYSISPGTGTIPSVVDGVIYVNSYGFDASGGSFYALTDSQLPANSIPEFPIVSIILLIVAISAGVALKKTKNKL